MINAHHHAKRIQSVVDEYDGPLEVVCVVEQHLLGTAGAVRNPLPLLQPNRSSFFTETSASASHST